jgi:hypothetical protein
VYVALCVQGKGLPGSFIQDSSMHLPLLQKLALDTCDSVEKFFNKPAVSFLYLFSSRLGVVCMLN